VRPGCVGVTVTSKVVCDSRLGLVVE